MTQSRPSLLRRALLASAAACAVIATPLAAEAAAYAFAANRITGLTVTFLGGGSPPTISNATTSVTDSANFTGFPGVTFSNPNIDVGLANNIPMATAGTGSFGGENNFSPVGPGIFNGTRSDASIGAGNASSGGVSVSNVAEGYATSGSGQAQSGNQATIQFTILGTGQQVRIAGVNEIQLIATAGLGETANAAIGNSASVRCVPPPPGPPATSCVPVPIPNSFGPDELNVTIGAGSIGPTAIPFEFITGVLTAGQLYTLALSSQAIVTIAANAVPEPVSLALLGAGLLGLAAVRFRRNG